jgi:PAS domain S-box-containing protein
MNADGAQWPAFRHADSRTVPAVTRDILPIPLSFKAALGFAGAYTVLLIAGYTLQFNPTSVTTVWPSDGVLLAMLLLLRRRDWPWIILMATALDVLTNWLTPGAFYLDSAIWYAVTHGFDGAVGAALTQRWIRGKSSQGQAVWFYFGAAVSCTLSTLLGLILYLSRHPEANPMGEWWTWWSGTFLGIVTFTPLWYLWSTRSHRPERPRPMRWWRQFAILAILLVASTVWIFGALPAISIFGSNLSFAIFPILVLLALHGPPRWAMLGAAAVVGLAAVLTNLGAGPFASPATPFSGVLSLQLFLALAAIMTLMISMAAEENRTLLVALTHSNRRQRRETRLLRDEIERNRILEQQRATAERRNAQLAALVRHSQEFIGIAALDGSGDFINDIGCRLLGIGPDESAGRFSLSDYVHPREHERLAREVMPAVITRGRWSGELDFRRIDDGAAIPMLVTAFRIDDADGKPLWIANVSRDITERRTLEIKLVAEATRNRLFLRTASDGVHILSWSGHIVDVSESFCKMLGYERHEMIGMYPTQWDAQLTEEEVRATFADLKSGELKRFNTLHRRKDGSVFPVEIHTERFDVEGEQYEYCSSRDMTDQRRLERALLEATSNEQHKLGRDVHDGLGQELAGISMLATAIATSLKKAGRSEAAEMADLAKFARQAVVNCRAIAHGLSPVAFADGGLIEVLQEMIALQRRSFDVDAQCEVIQAAPLRLAPEAVENLYRIAQEAVTNSRRHGRAHSIRVKLDIQPTMVRLDVLDDGVGFASSPARFTGMGLKIMRVRATIIGGRLSIGPGKHAGTLMTCECPQPAGNP